MTNYKIIIEYNGKNYSGWQVQENKQTIQQTLQDAIKNVTGEEVLVVGSGRTDSGVSAVGQVANFCLQKEIEPNKLTKAINAHLPQDIAVQSTQVVDISFNARFNAKSKTYNYYFYVSQNRKPLYDDFALQVKYANIDSMQKACKYLIGTHDFKSFVARNSGKTNFERTIYNAQISNVTDCLYKFSITGSGFLYNMVRIVMGTLIMIGEGKRTSGAMLDIIHAKDRTKAGKTVPAIGLQLFKVEY